MHHLRTGTSATAMSLPLYELTFRVLVWHNAKATRMRQHLVTQGLLPFLVGVCQDTSMPTHNRSLALSGVWNFGELTHERRQLVDLGMSAVCVWHVLQHTRKHSL